MNIVHAGVGTIVQSDVDLAQACGACIVGFNIRSPPITVTQSASRANVQVPSFFYHWVLLLFLQELLFDLQENN